MEPSKSKLKLMCYVCKLRYPKLYPACFPLYMFLRYSQIKATKLLYRIKPIPDKLVEYILKTHLSKDDFPIFDTNNTIFMNPSQLTVLGIHKFAKLSLGSVKMHHCALAVEYETSPDTILMGDTLYSNLKCLGFDSQTNIKPWHQSDIKIASSVNVSLINTPYEVSNATIDSILKHYFTTPKIVNKDHLISINLKKYGLDVYYTNIRVNKIDCLHFKCNNIEFGSKVDCVGPYFCIYTKTTLTQSVNKQNKLVLSQYDVIGDKLIDTCPRGLNNYFNEIERAFKPFISNKNRLNLKPMFLLQGSRGSGKMIIVRAVAKKFGFNLFKIPNCDISGSVYSLTETRLKNAVFRTKLSAPCMLVLKNFENFGKNNEGQYDSRLLNCFKRECEDLFSKNIFPVILICISNNKDIPADFKRTFLEVFDINAPSQMERVEILSWLLELYELKCDVDLDAVASKTHGFLYEDLEALIYYARMNEVIENGAKMTLSKDDFMKALDVMQLNYRHSLGAPRVPQVQWSDVGGLDDVKNEIIKSINLPLQHPKLLQKSGLHRSGILLYGPPGTGKTLIAKAVATECSLCFLSVKGPELLNSYVGQSEQNVREVFEKARQAAPCIIFFDELDSLAPNRGVTGDSGGVMDRIVSQLLAEIDGLNEVATIFVIGATNRPDLIDPALLRPGRFDKLLYVGPCTDKESKLSVLSALTRKFILSDKVNLKQVVDTCPENITGADFYGLCSSAWMSAARRVIKDIENGKYENDDVTQQSVVVEMDDFEFAINNVKPSVSAEDLLYFNKLKSELSANS